MRRITMGSDCSHCGGGSTPHNHHDHKHHKHGKSSSSWIVAIALLILIAIVIGSTYKQSVPVFTPSELNAALTTSAGDRPVFGSLLRLVGRVGQKIDYQTKPQIKLAFDLVDRPYTKSLAGSVAGEEMMAEGANSAKDLTQNGSVPESRAIKACVPSKNGKENSENLSDDGSSISDAESTLNCETETHTYAPINVTYNGLKPDMFEPARDVLIDGVLKSTANGGFFIEAHSILTQCPSKYEPPTPKQKVSE